MRAILAWAEAARRALLVAAARAPGVGAIVRSRERRIAARAYVAIGVALALAVLAPALTLAVSPIVLGVPHVASALRYLVLRQRRKRGAIAAIAAACAAMATLRMAEQWGGAPEVFARCEVVLAIAWALAAAVHGARISGARGRLALAIAAIAPFAVAAIAHPRAARIAFVHVHNLGAVVLWALVFRRGSGGGAGRARPALPGRVAAALLASLALLLSGATLPITRAIGAGVAAGVDIDAVAAWLAPGAAAAAPLVLAHAFTDSVHYAFWLGVIPDETLRGEGTLSFRMTWRGLLRDFGAPGLTIVATAAIAVAAGALFDASGARGAYFAVAGFHGYVEGAALVFFATSAPAGPGAVAGADRPIGAS